MIAVRLLRRPDGAEPDAAPLPVAASGALIGRAPDCDLVLADSLRLVSRQHALLLPQVGGTALLHCISASAALSVNGESLPPGGKRIVRVGDLLRIGGFEVAIEEAEPSTLPLPERPRARPAPVAPPARATPRPEPKSGEPALPPAQSSVFAPAPGRSSTPRRLRLDQWFNLDTAADPLGPGSPLPMLDNVTAAQLTSVAARNDASTLMAPAPTPVGNAPVRGSPAVVPPPLRQEPSAAASVPAEVAPLPEMLASARPAPVAAAGALPAVELEALRRAFLRGAGLDTGAATPAVTLDAAWMQHLGTLLRTATEGTLALLRSRAVAKRSIRAKGTRIAARENNLLKFAPDTVQALTLLVNVHGTRGFLEPAEALRDAHNDLQVHQLAMVAGMRAAVHELVSRLGPEATEAAEGPPRALARFVPALRSAALWRRHCQAHARLLNNLDGDFEAVFGREFLRAYEEQSLLAAVSTPAEGTSDAS